MRDRPSGRDLLAIARATFAQDILPALGGSQRLAALMIANAMSIAEREAAASDGPARALRDGLAAFYGEAISGESLEAATARLGRRLANDLRAQRFRADAARSAAAYRLLLDDARARVAASNPKYLRE